MPNVSAEEGFPGGEFFLRRAGEPVSVPLDVSPDRIRDVADEQVDVAEEFTCDCDGLTYSRADLAGPVLD